VVNKPDQSHASQVSRSSVATTEAEAIKEAVKEFNVAENLRNRIVATKENY